MIDDNTDKIRELAEMLQREMQGCQKSAFKGKYYFEQWNGWLTQLISLLPKPCETCGGSRKKLISGFCNMIHKYIPCPACSQALCDDGARRNTQTIPIGNITKIRRIAKQKENEE